MSFVWSFIHLSLFLPVPCKVPVIDHGLFRHLGKPGSELNETADIDNGEVIEFGCEQGYNVKGPSNLRCWHGQWTSTATATVMPECTPGKERHS